MIEIVHSDTIHRLAYVQREMTKQGEDLISARMLDLIKKVYKNEFTIAFCGHFSAGKSSMLNELYGADLLPTSPIPTSANVVKIQNGMDRVILLLSSGETHNYDGVYLDQELKEICKNGEEVIAIHLYRKNGGLPEGVSFLDTPGIDSTDDAHRIATESALHLADVIFYMMDYNHVQSEVNLQFVKELKHRQKRVYLVINQIDKHRESELTFAEYKQSVKQSFANWEIEVDGIFYTSLRALQHPYNEIKKFKGLIQQLITERDSYVKTSVINEAAYLIREHVAILEEKMKQKVKALSEDFAQPSLPTQTEIANHLQSLIREREVLEQQSKKIQVSYQKGIETILQNAYLMPFEVRDLAHRFLETTKFDFKIGFLFSKNKTEKEKEQRLNLFYEKLKQTVETQIDIHIKQYVIQFLKQHRLETEILKEQIYEASISFEPAMLQQVVKTGAQLNGNYVLQYTDDLASEIKRRYRQLAFSLYTSFSDTLEDQFRAQLKKINEHLHLYRKMEKISQEIAQLEVQHKAYAKTLVDVLYGNKHLEETLDLTDLLEYKQLPVSKERYKSDTLIKNEQYETKMDIERESKTLTGQLSSRIQRILENVKKSEGLLSGVKGLQAFQKELMEKRQRLEKKQFTVALFGAFSAGKSSFANALIGDRVLPVSPNPTTATINKICPPTTEHQHGEVLIQFKSQLTLLQDLQHVYKLFQQEVYSLEEALQGIDSLCSVPNPSTKQKTTFPFLRSVQQGYAFFEQLLGSTLTMRAEEAEEYIANEEKSCFVEFATLHFDSPLTQQGVTLVDTPGADSIHARHTDVAFQYIKNADAILFVTYYNHAFTRADREFIIQLGRVKDTFSMDKMFFIMNAADLASTYEELQAVKQYIGEQLLQYGIRNPKLFEVSSLLALEEKKEKVTKNSGIQAFEKSFTSFMMKDLLFVSLSSMNSDLKRSYQFLQQMVETTQQGNDQKQRQKEQYQQEQVSMQEWISNYSARSAERALAAEIQELLYYVIQRLILRYNDVFTEIFNPSALREDGSDMKQKLQSCVRDLIDFMQQDLLQEMRATSLRVEKWMNDNLDAHLRLIIGGCRKINLDLPLSLKARVEYDQPKWKEPLDCLTVQSFKKAMSTFKNTKSFFERNEKARMQEEMRQVLEQEVEKYILEQQKSFALHYQNEWNRALSEFKQKAISDCNDFYESLYFVLSENVDVSTYQEVSAKLKEQVEEIEQQLSYFS